MMTREKAIETLCKLPVGLMDLDNEQKWDLTEAIDLAIAALRAPTREQVERMRGEWVPCGFGKRGRGGIWNCTKCKQSYPVQNKFCPHCGAPMTDEAVDMMLERWREAVDDEN